MESIAPPPVLQRQLSALGGCLADLGSGFILCLYGKLRTIFQSLFCANQTTSRSQGNQSIQSYLAILQLTVMIPKRKTTTKNAL